jgi:hypothetical protein
MVKKAKKAAKKTTTRRKARQTKSKKKGLISRFVEAVSPTRRNAPGGNITRRQGV